jgi:ParB-like chromosome segregation protein Spo0J
VNNYLRLLALPEAVKESLRADRITSGHARALLSLPEEVQIKLCKKIEADSMSVRATESAVRELLGRPAPASESQEAALAATANSETIPFPAGGEQPSAEVTNHVRSLQEQLQQHLGLKVEIKVTGSAGSSSSRSRRTTNSNESSATCETPPDSEHRHSCLCGNQRIDSQS